MTTRGEGPGPRAQRAALEFWPDAFGLALQLTGRRAEAEDVCQEAFLRLGGAGEGLDLSRSLKPYLLRSVRNIVVDRRRRRQATDVEDPSTFPELRAAGPGELASAREERSMVREELERLTPRWRGVLYLRDGLDLSYREIGEILEMTEDVVRVTLHRARGRIREAIERRLGSEEER